MNDFNLRELQLCELEILKKVIEAFEKNNLSYFALFGTLIGAVRHEGFIPWDDDVDIGMPRKDYDTFIANADKILPDELQILHYTKNWRVPNKICRIENKNTTMAPLDKNGNIIEWQNHGVQIDIFPIDGCPATEQERVRFFKKIRKMMVKDTLFRQQISNHYSLKHNLVLLALSPIVAVLGRTYYIKKYKATAVVEFLTRRISFPISFTIEMNPFGKKTIDLDPLPREIDYPVVPLKKSLVEFISKLSEQGSLP